MADLSILAANVIPSSGATIRLVKAGATVTRGMTVYKDTGDANEYKPSDANGASPSNTVDGIALADADDGQYLPILIKDPALKIGATVAVGTAYVASATLGGIAPIADAVTGWRNTIIGIGVSTTELSVDLENKLDSGADVA